MNKGVCRICAWLPRVISSTKSLQRPICMAAGMHKQQAVVRRPQSEDQLMISLPLAGRIRNLDRPKSERLEKALGRLRSNALPKADKNNKKKVGKAAASASPDIFVGLYAGPSLESPLLPGSVTNEEAWQHGRLLVVGTQQYIIDLNPPIVEKVELPGLPMVGYPICPLPVLLFAEDDLTQWQWYRSTCHQTSTPAATHPHSDASGAGEAGHHAGFEVIPGAVKRLYVPSQDDIHHSLRVQCVPASRFLEPQYRRPLILQELLGFHADIICLQEVDEKAFAEYFLPHLQHAGFDGHYTNKASSTREGEATFYRLTRFRLAARQDLSLKDCFVNLLQPPSQAADSPAAQRAQRHAQFEPMLRSSPHLQQVLQGVATVAQMTLLEPVCSHRGGADRGSVAGSTSEDSNPQESSLGSSICVVNTHFFFHPSASHVRNIHTAATLSEVQAFMHEHSSQASVRDGNHASTTSMGAVTTAEGQASDFSEGSSGKSPATAAEGQKCDTSGAASAHSQASVRGQTGSAPQPTLVFTGDLNSDFNDGTPGTQSEASAGSRSTSTQQAGSGLQPALLFCGDLNCGLSHGTPGVVQLLNTGQLARDFWDWDYSAGFRWGPDAGEEEAAAEEMQPDGNQSQAPTNQSFTDPPTSAAAPNADSKSTAAAEPVTGIPLGIPFQLRSADGLQTPFTNYVRGYSGLLDYIWFEPSRLKVERAIPLPSLKEVQGYLPSHRFPSDHLSVVYDFSWQTAPSQQQPELQSLSEQPGASSSSSQPEGLQSAPHSTSSSTAPQPPSPELSNSQLQLLPPRQMAAFYPIAALPNNINRAVSALQQGQVIAVPTDTLYGLAADAGSTTGIESIYSIKHRQAYAPLAICIADMADLSKYCCSEHLPEQLLQQLLPGPVTLILDRKAAAPLCAELNPGLQTIGVRIPDHEFMRAVCRRHGGAIALTSANISGGTSPLTVNDFMHLWPQCAAVFNGKRIQADRAGSTIVDLSVAGKFKIDRKGVAFDAAQQALLQCGLQPQL